MNQPRLVLFAAVSFGATLAASSAQSPQYETPPVLRASEIWESNLLSGPHHRVREEVITSGVPNTSPIDSEFGVFYAQGDHLLTERVREIYAIAALRKTKETDAYAKAVGSTAADSIKGAENLIKDPAGALRGLGQGAGRFLRSAGERMKTTGEGNDAAQNLKQYTEAKRQIAGEYQVDPYTSNIVYQAEVDGIASASTAGGLTFKLASLAIPGGGGIALRGLTLSQDLNDTLVQSGPYDLRVRNRDRLRAMSISDSLIEPFLDHPHLTPRHRTAITLALQQLEGARFRSDFVRLALSARSEEDAFFFSTNAAVLALYHRKRAGILTIVDCKGIPAAYTTEHRLIMPILLDYGSWTELGANFVQSVATFERPDLQIASRELVLTGVLTPRAKAETVARGVAVTERALQTLAP